MKRAMVPFLLGMALAVGVLTGCDKHIAYDRMTTEHLVEITEADASPDEVLDWLLIVTEIELNAAEKTEMREHIRGLSGAERRLVLANLYAAGDKGLPGNYPFIDLYASGADGFTYPVPDGTTKVQFLQQLLTTSQ